MPEAVTRADLVELHARTLVGGDAAYGLHNDCDDDRLVHDWATLGAHWDLPDAVPVSCTLDEVLRRRVSAQSLSQGTLCLESIAHVLARAVGLVPLRAAPPAPLGSGPLPLQRRAYPSGGALYSVELLLFPFRVESLEARFWRLQAGACRFVAHTATMPSAGVEACFSNLQVGDACALILLVCDLARPSLGKYGAKAYRLVLLEAGHLAQNLLLAVEAEQLAALPLAGFDDSRLAVLAGLRYPEEVVLYAIALGRPS